MRSKDSTFLGRHEVFGKVREARLRWSGHVQKKDSGYIGIRMLSFELPDRRPNRSFIYVVKEDKKVVGVRAEDAEDRLDGGN